MSDEIPKIPKILIPMLKREFPILTKPDIVNWDGDVWNEETKTWEPKYDPICPSWKKDHEL